MSTKWVALLVMLALTSGYLLGQRKTKAVVTQSASHVVVPVDKLTIYESFTGEEKGETYRQTKMHSLEVYSIHKGDKLERLKTSSSVRTWCIEFDDTRIFAGEKD